jgi:hypothetical protein
MLRGRDLDLGRGFVVVAVGEGGGMPLFLWIQNQTEECLLGSSLESRNWILSLRYYYYTCVPTDLGTKRTHVWLAH